MALIDNILNGIGNRILGLGNIPPISIEALSYANREFYTNDDIMTAVYYILFNDMSIKKYGKKNFIDLVKSIEREPDGSVFQIEPSLIIPHSVGEVIEMSDGAGIANAPIEVFVPKTTYEIVISDGHHRWYEALKNHKKMVKVKKVAPPFAHPGSIRQGIGFCINDKRRATLEMKKKIPFL